MLPFSFFHSDVLVLFFSTDPTHTGVNTPGTASSSFTGRHELLITTLTSTTLEYKFNGFALPSFNRVSRSTASYLLRDRLNNDFAMSLDQGLGYLFSRSCDFLIFPYDCADQGGGTQLCQLPLFNWLFTNQLVLANSSQLIGASALIGSSSVELSLPGLLPVGILLDIIPQNALEQQLNGVWVISTPDCIRNLRVRGATFELMQTGDACASRDVFIGSFSLTGNLLDIRFCVALGSQSISDPSVRLRVRVDVFCCYFFSFSFCFFFFRFFHSFHPPTHPRSLRNSPS